VSETTVHCQPIVEMRFQENAYVVYTRSGGPCWIVDPGFAPQHERIAAFIQQHRLTPEAILITHGHADHIAGVDDVDRLYPGIGLWVGENEKPMLYDSNLNLSAPFGHAVEVRKETTRTLRAGDRMELDGTSWEVLDTSGHSPGGVSFYCAQAGVALVGDALFAGSIGRTDFPGGSHEKLIDNIRRHLFNLPDQTVVHSGHGPATTVEIERKSNPFFVD
jgi:hydroxyacylglutathione hydrolase